MRKLIPLLIVLLWASSAQAVGTLRVEALTDKVTIASACLDSLGHLYLQPDTIRVKVIFQDNTADVFARTVAASGTNNLDSVLSWNATMDSIDGGNGEGLYLVNATFVNNNESVEETHQFYVLYETQDVNVVTWDGTAAATADNGWVTSDGDTNTTVGITYAVDQRAKIGDTNSTTGITYAVDQRAKIGDTNSTTGITFAVNQRGVIGDTNQTHQGDTLTMILADVTGINGADGSAWITATGFAVPGDAMTLQSDSLRTLMADVDSALVMMFRVRDSLQYLITSDGDTNTNPFDNATDGVDAIKFSGNSIAADNLETYVTTGTGGVTSDLRAVLGNATNSSRFNDLLINGWDAGGDVMRSTFSGDSLATIMSDLDSSLVMMFRVRDSIQFLVTSAGDTNQFDYTDTLTTLSTQIQEMLDSIRGQGWAAVGGGSGVKTVVTYAIDSSGTDDTLSGVNIYVLNTGQTQTIAQGITNGSPANVSLVMDSTTSYTALTYIPGFVFDPYSLTTTDGVTPDTIAIQGYNVSASATPSSHQTALSGTCRNILGEGLSGAMVEITLTGATAMFSSTNEYPPGRIVVYSDGSGDWSATIVGTDSLQTFLPAGVTATYCVQWRHPEAVFNACGLSIAANGSTTTLRDVLAQ